MVEIIEQMQTTNPPPNICTTITREWTTNWAKMPSPTKLAKPTKPHEVFLTSPNKFIFVEEIFQDINKQMLETNYTLNLEQLLKITPHLKQYVWQRLKLDKPQTNIKPMTNKTTTFVVFDINTIAIAINNLMVVI